MEVTVSNNDMKECILEVVKDRQPIDAMEIQREVHKRLDLDPFNRRNQDRVGYQLSNLLDTKLKLGNRLKFIYKDYKEE